MKLNIAATVLASAAMNLSTVSAVYSNAAGTCLSAVIANAGQQQDVDWSDEAAYYTIGNTNKNYYNANNDQDGDEQEEEAEAEEAEYNIQTQMRSLAEALGLDYQEEEGEDGENGNQQAFNYQELNYVMAYDEELANTLGMEDDRNAFAKFYSVLYDLALSGDGDQCNAGNNNNANYDDNNNDGDADGDADADDANEEEQEEDMDQQDDEEEEEENEDEENEEEDDQEEENDEEDDRDEEQNDEEGEDQEEEGGEDGEGEDGEDRRRLEENDEQQIENAVTNIVRNCGSVFYAFGVDLGDIDMDEDNDELQEALHDLSIHIRIEKAIASGAFNFEDGINYNFAANGNENNGEEGNYDEEFYNLLQSLDIDENELQEDDIMNIKLKLAVKSGALKEYLEANAAFGSVVNDWEGVIQGFFYSLGIEEEINLEDIDSYLATDIYNTEYNLEESGCQQAMLNQFGKSEAKDYGYIENTNPIADFFNATVENLSSGQTAGIVIGVLIAVGIISCCAFRCGKKAGKKSRSSRNDPLIGGTAV